MIRPSQVSFYAKKAEKKNQQFRTWLKTHVDPDELDKQFLELHNELFADYDCSRCRNCCKEYHGSIPVEDVERDATFLHMSVDEFKNKYLNESLEDGGYSTRNVPCDFLSENGSCILGDCILNFLSFLTLKSRNPFKISIYRGFRPKKSRNNYPSF